MLREYTVSESDPLVIARAFQIPLMQVTVRLGVTTDYVRKLTNNPRLVRRVRCAVLELALEKDRFQEAYR